MKMKMFRWLFLMVIGTALFLSFWSEPVTFGISTQWSNGNYRFAGGTHPVALAFAGIVTALYLLLMFAPEPRYGEPLPGVFRRLVAFCLDFLLAMMIAGPVMGILPTLTEWRRTRDFQWTIERTTQAPGDGWLVAAGLIFGCVALVFFFTFPITRLRPSPGACIAGYQIVPDEGIPVTFRMAMLRTLLGFISLCAAYLAPFIARDRKHGKFWLDQIFGTRAVTLT